MRLRCSRPTALLAASLALCAFPAPAIADEPATPPASAASDPTLPAVVLKLAPELVPPEVRSSPRPPGRQGARASPAPQVPQAPLKIAPFAADGGAVFVRADALTGVAERYVEAEGKVELRTRTETVLADWLRYDLVTDEVWGKGNVRLRRGFDWITGPEAKFKRDTDTGFFKSPKFFIAENGSRGDASEIRFIDADHYEVSDARYTTCVAPREDWYIRTEELEIDRSRNVGTAHNATVMFLGMPIPDAPWL